MVTIPEGDFPGDDSIYAQADELCTAESESFVGLPYEESALYLNHVTPDEESWDAGERGVVCVVYDQDGDTTGTLADANR